MNKSIQDQLQNIMELTKNENPDSSLNKDLDLDMKSEISNFFDSGAAPKKDPTLSDEEKKAEEIKERMAKKEKVQKDVQAFLNSLPENVEKPEVTSMKNPQKPPKPKKTDETSDKEEEEKITSRKLTK